ncbi:MAG: GSCFA domain-containing protein, partial [Muribaculaceae bacterium]|nr:GSCFA domain-containing protein [Muribaculaceae bacterium]
MIAHGIPVWTIGSCFADNIGRRLADDLFEVRANPFGPLFNPASIEEALLRAASGREVEPGEFFEHEGVWRSFGFHSRVSGRDACEAAAKANGLI